MEKLSLSLGNICSPHSFTHSLHSSHVGLAATQPAATQTPNASSRQKPGYSSTAGNSAKLPGWRLNTSSCQAPKKWKLRTLAFVLAVLKTQMDFFMVRQMRWVTEAAFYSHPNKSCHTAVSHVWVCEMLYSGSHERAPLPLATLLCQSEPINNKCCGCTSPCDSYDCKTPSAKSSRNFEKIQVYYLQDLEHLGPHSKVKTAGGESTHVPRVLPLLGSGVRT